jgi:hypothetical protein
VAVKPTSKENVVERELLRRVLALGGKCEKVQIIGKRGFVDRLVALPGGRIILVEVKRPRGGVVSPHQRKFHREYRALGIVVAIVKTLEDIDLLLATHTSYEKRESRSDYEIAPA